MWLKRNRPGPRDTRHGGGRRDEPGIPSHCQGPDSLADEPESLTEIGPVLEGFTENRLQQSGTFVARSW